MAKITKSSGVQGAWLDKKELKGGEILKLVSEAKEEVGQNGPQLVAKCRIKGWEGDAKNISINKPSKNALVDAFGDESKDWIDKLLTVNVERGVFSGKRGIAMYLIPESYELKEDSDGYLKIVNPNKDAHPTEELPEDDIQVAEIPF